MVPLLVMDVVIVDVLKISSFLSKKVWSLLVLAVDALGQHGLNLHRLNRLQTDRAHK